MIQFLPPVSMVPTPGRALVRSPEARPKAVKWQLILPGVLLLFSSSACAASPDLTSLLATTPITVDGDPAEWDGRTTYLSDEKISLGVQHTEDALFVNWVLSDPARQRMVLGRGITLWIDPDGGDDHEIGVRFPLGLRAGRVDPASADGRFEEPGDPADSKFLLEDMLGSLELIAGSDTLRVESGEHGVEVAAKNVGGSLVYEARLSLADGGFLATHAPKGIGNRVGLGLLTPKLDRSKMRDGRGPGGPGGGLPGGGRGGGSGEDGGGRPGGRGGAGSGGRPGAPPPGMRGEMPSVDVWVSVAL